MDPVIGREKEIERIIQIICRRTKNNPVLTGEPGVGKTAVVEGLSQKICREDVPEKLRSKRIVMLDLGLLVAGTKYRGEFEDRVKKVMEEVRKPKTSFCLLMNYTRLLVPVGLKGVLMRQTCSSLHLPGVSSNVLARPQWMNIVSVSKMMAR